MNYLTICIIAVCCTKQALTASKTNEKSEKKIELFMEKLLGSDKFIELAQKFADEVAVKIKTATRQANTELRSYQKDKVNPNESSSTEAQESNNAPFKKIKVNARDIIENIKNISSDNLALKFKNLMKKIQHGTNQSKKIKDPINEQDSKETDVSDESRDDNNNNDNSEDSDVEKRNKEDERKVIERNADVKEGDGTEDSGSSSSDTDDTSKTVESKGDANRRDSSEDNYSRKGKERKQERSHKEKDAVKKNNLFRSNVIDFTDTERDVKNSTENMFSGEKDTSTEQQMKSNKTTKITPKNYYVDINKRGTSMPRLRADGGKTFAYMSSPDYQEYHEMAKAERQKEKDQDYFSIINE